MKMAGKAVGREVMADGRANLSWMVRVELSRTRD